MRDHVTRGSLKGWGAALLLLGASHALSGCGTAATDHYFRGIDLDQAGRSAESIAEFTRAIELEPENPEPRHGRALAYLHMGDLDHAIADLDAAIEMEPGYALAYNSRGVVHMTRKAYERALEDFRRAAEIDPEFDDARINEAFAYGEIGQYQSAIEVYDALIKESKFPWVAYNNRGNIRAFKLKEFDRAIQDYDKAIELDDEYGLAYANRGNARQEIGDHEGACRDWRGACALGIRHACASVTKRCER